MLNNFLNFLDQTDVTQVTWAQYMDVTCCNGTGLLDYYGNARPSWHSFKFWGDIPTERVVPPSLSVSQELSELHSCRSHVSDLSAVSSDLLSLNKWFRCISQDILYLSVV